MLSDIWFFLFALPAARQAGVLLSSDQLDFSVHLDLVAYYYAASFGDGAPGEAKFFTADLTADGETGLGLSIGVFYDAAEFHVQGNGFGYSFDGEVAMQFGVIAFCFVFGAYEFQLGVFGRMEEVFRFEVGVPLVAVGVDGVDVGGEQDLGGGVKVVSFSYNVQVEFIEMTGDGADDEVFNLKGDF